MSRSLILAAVGLAAALFAGVTAAQGDPVKVFVLAGQSNMEGKAQNKLWEHQAVDAKTAAFFAPFRDDDNQQWVVRDDVWIKFFGRKGPLTLGFGSNGRTGLEYAFGVHVGDRLEAPVLLVKTAWGGRSIRKDFRPPSSGLPSDAVLERSSPTPSSAPRTTTRSATATTRYRRARKSRPATAATTG